LTSSASGQIFYDHYLENKLNRLKAECIAEDTAQKEREPHLDFRMICDPEELEGVEVKGQGVQAKLVSAYHDLRSQESSSRFF
jgi:hypothetical protein